MENTEKVLNISCQEITVSELAALEKNSYILVDIRDEMSYGYGHLPNAVHIPAEQLESRLSELGENTVVVYCKKGETGLEAAELLKAKGIEAYNLKGGYIAWLMERVSQEQKNDKTEDFCLEIGRAHV